MIALIRMVELAPALRPCALSFLVTSSAMADSQKHRQGGALRIIGFLSGLFVADVQYNGIAGIVVRLALVRDSDGRAKFVRIGSFRFR